MKIIKKYEDFNKMLNDKNYVIDFKKNVSINQINTVYISKKTDKKIVSYCIDNGRGYRFSSAVLF